VHGLHVVEIIWVVTFKDLCHGRLLVVDNSLGGGLQEEHVNTTSLFISRDAISNVRTT